MINVVYATILEMKTIIKTILGIRNHEIILPAIVTLYKQSIQLYFLLTVEYRPSGNINMRIEL